jgi:hypothetical protein
MKSAVKKRRWRSGSTVPWCFPPLAAPLTVRSGVGFVGGRSGFGQPRELSRRPLPPLYIAQCDGGPPTI